MYRARRRWSAAVGTVAVASLVTATQRRGGPAAHDTHTLEFLIMHLRSCLAGGLGAALLLPLAGIASAAPTTGQFQFEPLPASSPCTPGGNPAQQIVLPPGFVQTEIAREGQGGTRDLWDMNTVNETGPDAGRFLYRTHEISPNAQVSVTDLQTGETRVLAKRADWERFDGIAWTPWGTIIAAEEVSPAAVKDPAVPQAVGGLVYEIDPVTGAAVARPAVGSRSHEGLRFDALGNLYGISERNPGYIYRFTPDRRGDLASGQLYALKVTNDDGDNDPLTGSATWVPLDRAAVQVDSDAAAAAAGATGYNRPEDIETADSTGNSRGGQALFVAVTGDDSVYKVDLRQPAGGKEHLTAAVSAYVRAGVNAPADFDSPDNLALDHNGNLYITEDPGGSAPAKTLGDDIWVAVPSRGGAPTAEDTVRFASITDCNAEPTGIYFSKDGNTLYVNIQHRGGDGADIAYAVTQADQGNQPTR
jgi:hypothetical protein